MAAATFRHLIGPFDGRPFCSVVLKRCASEVTTLWRYTDLFISITIIMRLSPQLRPYMLDDEFGARLLCNVNRFLVTRPSLE